MKTSVLILSLLACLAGAFGQGKVSLQMGLPIYFGYDLFPQDIAFENQIVPNNGNTLGRIATPCVALQTLRVVPAAILFQLSLSSR